MLMHPWSLQVQVAFDDNIMSGQTSSVSGYFKHFWNHQSGQDWWSWVGFEWQLITDQTTIKRTHSWAMNYIQNYSILIISCSRWTYNGAENRAITPRNAMIYYNDIIITYLCVHLKNILLNINNCLFKMYVYALHNALTMDDIWIY